MRNIVLTTLITFIFGFTIPNKETIYIGKVYLDNSMINENISDLYIEFKINKKVIAISKLDEKGIFKIRTNKNKKFDIYYKAMGINETYLKTIKPGKLDTIMLNFKIPKEYLKILDKVICPKCEKYDETIRINYGLSNYVVYKNKPNRIYTEDGKEEIYDGGCGVSDLNPKWYCKRDKLKF